MTQIYNSDLTKELTEGAKIQVSRDRVPNQLADKVVPVMEVNPKLLRRVKIVKNVQAANATSATVFTTPTDRDFYLTGYCLSVIKDATSTSTGTSLRSTIDGAAVRIAEIIGLSLTVQNQTITGSCTPPIKIDRGVTITVNNTTNVANVSSSAEIHGYIDDYSLA